MLGSSAPSPNLQAHRWPHSLFSDSDGVGSVQTLPVLFVVLQRSRDERLYGLPGLSCSHCLRGESEQAAAQGAGVVLPAEVQMTGGPFSLSCRAFVILCCRLQPMKRQLAPLAERIEEYCLLIDPGGGAQENVQGVQESW